MKAYKFMKTLSELKFETAASSALAFMVYIYYPSTQCFAPRSTLLPHHPPTSTHNHGSTHSLPPLNPHTHSTHPLILSPIHLLTQLFAISLSTRVNIFFKQQRLYRPVPFALQWSRCSSWPACDQYLDPTPLHLGSQCLQPLHYGKKKP